MMFLSFNVENFDMFLNILLPQAHLMNPFQALVQ